MLYAAYGSNMNLEQMKRRCPNSRRVCNGLIENYKLVFNVHLDIVPKKKSMVPVVLWEIDEFDWSSLDFYEGYPAYYIREVVDVVLENGKKTKAIVYVMTESCKGISPPSKHYFDACLDGCRANGIDSETLYSALADSFFNETYYNQYNPRKGKKAKYGRYTA